MTIYCDFLVNFHDQGFFFLILQQLSLWLLVKLNFVALLCCFTSLNKPFKGIICNISRLEGNPCVSMSVKNKESYACEWSLPGQPNSQRQFYLVQSEKMTVELWELLNILLVKIHHWSHILILGSCLDSVAANMRACLIWSKLEDSVNIQSMCESGNKNWNET